MTTIIITHEVNDGSHWAKAWKKGTGSRHEMFVKYGLKARTFKDSLNPDFTGLLVEISDMNRWQEALDAEEVKKAMGEDGLKIETFRMLTEFTP